MPEEQVGVKAGGPPSGPATGGAPPEGETESWDFKEMEERMEEEAPVKEGAPPRHGLPPPARAPPPQPAPPPAAVRREPPVTPPQRPPLPGPPLPQSALRTPQFAPVPPPPALPPVPLSTKRARAMKNSTVALMGLGVFDIIVSVTSLFPAGLGLLSLVPTFVNLGVLLGLAVYALSLLPATMDELTLYEGGNMKLVLGGVVVILVVPFHETYNLFAVGYYAPPWNFFNYILLVLGTYFVTKGILRSRERGASFGVWAAGLVVLILAPVHNLIDGLVPGFLLSVWYLDTTLALFAAVLFGAGFALLSIREKQSARLESVMADVKQFGEYNRLPEALDRCDEAIAIAHDLYSHLLEPDETGAQRQVRLPPAYWEPWVRKSLILARSRRVSKALALLDMLLEIDGSNPHVWFAKGEILAGAERHAEAVYSYDQSIRLEPANALFRQKREAAAEIAKKAANQPEESPKAA